MFELNDKTALVVGGAGHLGLPVAEKLATQSAEVFIADCNYEAAKKGADEVLKKLPNCKVNPVHLDVTDEDSISAAVAEITSQSGELDIMVNLAAGGTAKTVEEMEAEDFDETLRINLTGNFLLTRECARNMGEGGSIILYSSMYGRVSPDPGIYEAPMKPNPIDYGTGKGGIEQMIRYLAVHWAPRKIRVNGICPGPFPNADKPSYAADEGFQGFLKRLAAKVPLGRVGRRDETAGAVVFLASEEASFITGQTLVIDGGWTIW